MHRCVVGLAALALGWALTAGEASAQGASPQDCQGAVATGSAGVSIEGKSAARAGDATGCGGTVSSGAASVFINGKPAAGLGDQAGCAGK